MFQWRRDRSSGRNQAGGPPAAADLGIGATDICVVDLETTGFYRSDRVIEIAVARIDSQGTVLAEYETLVNPGRTTTNNCHIHGISDRHLVDAPTFEQIAGDLASILDGSVWAAHNATFDSRFLAQEFAQLGKELPAWPMLCTMRLSPLCGGPTQPTLAECHRAFGQPSNETLHRAMGDVRVTSEILKQMLVPYNGQRFRVLSICDRPEWEAPLPALRTTRAGTGRTLTRERIGTDATIETQSVRGEGADANGISAYASALESSMEDRLLHEREREELIAIGIKIGLSSDQAENVHHEYFRKAASRALFDGRIDSSQKKDLNQIAHLLEIEEVDAERLLESASTDIQSEKEPLEGLGVCFTGQVDAKVGGQRLTRSDLKKLAAEKGMVIKSGVSMKVDLLVTSDPHSVSSKTKKARELGIRITTVEAFLTAAEVAVD